MQNKKKPHLLGEFVTAEYNLPTLSSHYLILSFHELIAPFFYHKLFLSPPSSFTRVFLPFSSYPFFTRSPFMCPPFILLSPLLCVSYSLPLLSLLLPSPPTHLPPLPPPPPPSLSPTRPSYSPFVYSSFFLHFPLPFFTISYLSY